MKHAWLGVYALLLALFVGIVAYAGAVHQERQQSTALDCKK